MGRNIDADGLTANKVCTGTAVLTILLEKLFFCSSSVVHVNVLHIVMLFKRNAS